MTDSVDIAIMAPPYQLSPTIKLPATTKGMVLSQQSFFCGLPSLLRTQAQGLNNGFPIPFIKHAIISAMTNDKYGNLILFLDGHNNPGFSGGPVVFWDKSQNEFKIAGVINSYRTENLL